MRFLIIIPAHNEEDSILLCLKSLAKQTYQNFDCIVVNDGSTDKTKELVESFIKDNLSFKLKNLESSFHQPGAKVVQTFYRGLEEVSLADYDVICKFDADIIFPSQYLENINKIYTENPKAGMVSGLVYIQNDKGEWIYENLSSKNHVRGPIKSYRKDCFLAMNGLRSVLGWDNIDVMLAQMNGYDIITIKNLWVKHLRPTAYKYKSQKAEKLGEYFYNIGLNLPLAMISSAKSSFKNGSFLEFFITMKSFLSQNKSLQLTQEEIKFIRKLRNPLQKIFNRQ
ncbi:glycosyltransferase family 2 protein [Riemerella anatipestifer]|uniref:glycosyltransferase family 2 protein n=1 Tax=Riemerella anatipestifer TaxID=34085 RepID=UPI0012ADD2C4|nr:glycosyltransferase family 2 protein [Riemerella anatipestifer]USL95457.1 glycosyltransferase family 2 protein [Riemerella anatipestifer]